MIGKGIENLLPVRGLQIPEKGHHGHRRAYFMSLSVTSGYSRLFGLDHIALLDIHVVCMKLYRVRR